MARTMLRRVKVQVAVSKLDTAVSLPRDVRVRAHHQDGVAGVVQFAKIWITMVVASSRLPVARRRE